MLLLRHYTFSFLYNIVMDLSISFADCLLPDPSVLYVKLQSFIEFLFNTCTSTRTLKIRMFSIELLIFHLLNVHIHLPLDFSILLEYCIIFNDRDSNCQLLTLLFLLNLTNNSQRAPNSFNYKIIIVEHSLPPLSTLNTLV